jgi:hypothetical protein
MFFVQLPRLHEPFGDFFMQHQQGFLVAMLQKKHSVRANQFRFQHFGREPESMRKTRPDSKRNPAICNFD